MPHLRRRLPAFELCEGTMKLLTALFFLFLVISPASGACYWQAPVADNSAWPPPNFIQRCDLGELPIYNDPATLDQIEVINPGTNSQRYLNDLAQAFIPDANGMPTLLSYILPFTPKRSAAVQLIFETFAPVFHFYAPDGAPYCIGEGAAPSCPNYTTANPHWTAYARVWKNGHDTHQNLSMVLQLPPNTIPLGSWVKLLIDPRPDGGPNHMWVISE